MIHELLKYYCTSYTGKTTYNGKTVPRVYEFSRYSGIKKRPYSLRLRMEEGESDTFRMSRKDLGEKQRHGRRQHSQDGDDANGPGCLDSGGQKEDDRDDEGSDCS